MCCYQWRWRFNVTDITNAPNWSLSQHFSTWNHVHFAQLVSPLSRGTLIWIWIPIGIQITIESADCISHSTVALVVNDVMVVVIDNWFRWRKWLLLQWLLSLCILDYFDWSIDENNVLEGGRDAWSTSHYSINLRVVLEVVRKVFFLRFVAGATPPRSVHDFCIFSWALSIFILHWDTLRW